MKTSLSIILLVSISFTCLGQKQDINDKSSHVQELCTMLYEHQGKGIFFGAQDATGYGVGWKNDNLRSDIKSVCGSYPAIGGWGADYSPCQIARGEGFEEARFKIKLFHDLGGFNTMEWHTSNPNGGGYYWKDRKGDCDNIVASILPGGEKHVEFTEQLDNLAAFFNSLLDDEGRKIPVIFRPWHEHNGDWFWWGQRHCSKEEYIELWRFTVDYLEEKKGVNNLLWAYSTDRFKSEEKYLERYPGDDYIDILGLDNYWDLRHKNTKLDAFIKQLQMLVKMAEERDKLAALTETGQDKLETTDWFTQTLLKGLLHDEATRKISYVLVWRNARENLHHAPYVGHPSENDFMRFYQDEHIIFMDEIDKSYFLQ